MIKEKLQKEIEKECFDEFGFNKNNDVKWIIKKSVELTMNETLKNPKIFGLIDKQDVLGLIDEILKPYNDWFLADDMIGSLIKQVKELKARIEG